MGQEVDEMANLLSTCTIFDISDDIKIETVRIRRAHKLTHPDAIIAATAAVLKIHLITADRKFDRPTEQSIILFEF